MYMFQLNGESFKMKKIIFVEFHCFVPPRRPLFLHVVITPEVETVGCTRTFTQVGSRKFQNKITAELGYNKLGYRDHGYNEVAVKKNNAFGHK